MIFEPGYVDVLDMPLKPMNHGNDVAGRNAERKGCCVCGRRLRYL